MVVIYLRPSLLVFLERNIARTRGGARRLARAAPAISGQMETIDGLVEVSHVRSEVKEGVGRSSDEWRQLGTVLLDVWNVSWKSLHYLYYVIN